MADDVPAPTDDELDALIMARLRLLGVDLGQLPATTTDPDDGSPSRPEALGYLRTLLRESAVQLSSWSPPPEDRPDLAQQVAPPSLYPSTADAWTDGGLS